ncbi:LytR C-terminal domain-containing protein [Streptomyces chisholmiae]|nr:LytR C-terminal domain-containing protein [Streptomyces sp. DSM 44915]
MPWDTQGQRPRGSAVLGPRAAPRRPQPRRDGDAVEQRVQASVEASDVAPGEVRVHLRNGTGDPELALRAATALRALGFDVVSSDDAPGPASATVIGAPVARAGQARALAARVPNAVIHLAPGTTDALTLTLGPDYTGVRAPLPGVPRQRG